MCILHNTSTNNTLTSHPSSCFPPTPWARREWWKSTGCVVSGMHCSPARRRLSSPSRQEGLQILKQFSSTYYAFAADCCCSATDPLIQTMLSFLSGLTLISAVAGAAAQTPYLRGEDVQEQARCLHVFVWHQRPIFHDPRVPICTIHSKYPR